MGVTDNYGELWRELGGCSWDVPPCAGWLPPQVTVNHLLRGQSQPIQLDPIAFEPDDIYTYLRETNFRLRCGKDNTRYVVSAETDERLFELYDTQQCPYLYAQSLAEEGWNIAIAYDPDSKLLATYGWGEGVSIWFMWNGIGKRIKQLNTDGYELEFTPDGEQLRARNINAWKIYSIADILNTADTNN